MSVNATGSIFNTQKQYQYAFRQAVKDKLAGLERKRKGYKKFLKTQGRFKTSQCTQCKRKFDKYLADQQIENKRENAPIYFSL